MNEWQEQLKRALSREWKKLEELETFYHSQVILARELMCRAEDNLVSIEQEKHRIMQNSSDLDCIRKPKGGYQRPFLFLDDE